MALYIGNYRNAIKYLRQAYLSAPDDAGLLYNLAYAFYKNNELDSANVYLNRSLALVPGDKDAIQLKTEIGKKLKKQNASQNAKI
jgi:Flp pilus assembly protein TadD